MSPGLESESGIGERRGIVMISRRQPVGELIVSTLGLLQSWRMSNLFISLLHICSVVRNI
jgi:hypothetical protein